MSEKEERIEYWQKYAREIVDGKRVAGKYIRLAAQRYLDWFDRKDIFFDYERMDRIENFINHMKHFEGSFAGKPFLLLDFQRFVLANIFGWYYTDKPTKRVVEYAVLFIARKNAKTALSSAILLSELCVNRERGSEQYIAANSREQAKIALKFVKGYAKSLDPKGKHFKLYTNYVEYPKTNSICKVLSAEAGIQDGANPSCFLIDEEQSAPNDAMFQVLQSGQGMRENPLAIVISSGGYLMDGFPFYERVKIAHDRLDGVAELPDDAFYALYELDKDDDWTDPKVYEKANPSLGEIVREKFLKKRLADSMVSMTTQTDFKIKNLDIFVTAKNIWLEPDVITSTYKKVDMERLKGEPCYIGCDLSSVSDLTAVAACWPPNEFREYYPDKYIFKVWTWVPQAALESTNGNLYKTWIRQGYLKMTSGNSVDYEEILADVMHFNDNYPITKFMYDPWMATSFVQQAVAQGLTMQPMSQSVGSFSRSTKSFEVSSKHGQIIIDGNSLISWAFQNAELKTDSYGNIKPIKAGNMLTKKIDPVIAILTAMSGYLFEELAGSMELITLE